MKADITGQRFGKLTAIRTTGEKRWGVYLWECRCDCGNLKTVAVNTLRSLTVRSCGCLLKEAARARPQFHGYYGTTTYKTWDSMVQRCANEKSTSYPQYGGIGISVCDRWKVFKNFLEDMGERPEGMSLDRINPFGNYCLDNCRWATVLLQARNKRKRCTTFEQAETVRKLYAEGVSPKEIHARTGIGRSSINGIIYLGQISKPNDY